MLWWWTMTVAVAAEGTRHDVVDVLRIATGRDGLVAGRAGLVARLASACGAGDGAACALAEVPLADRAAIEQALAPRCDAGDAVACLGAAWAALGPTATGELPPGLDAPPAFVARVTAACDGGVARGCTELGTAWARGWAGYPHRGRARAHWAGACKAGDLRGCTLHALDTGEDPPADDVLALLVATPPEPGPARSALERACLAGASVGCARFASMTSTLPDTARAETRTACAEGSVAACALDVQLDLVAGALTTEEALPKLDAACGLLPEACEEAAFLRQGAPPVTGYPEPPPLPVEVQRGLYDLGPAHHRCLLEAVGRGAVAGPPLEVALRLDLAGQVVGAYVANPLDPYHGTCVTDVLRTARVSRRDATAPALVRTRLPAGHAPEIRLTPRVDASDTGSQAARLRRDVPSWEAPLDACARTLGTSAQDLRITVDLVAHRDGTFTDVTLLEGSDDDTVDACIVDWLRAHRARHAVRMTTPLRVEIVPLRPKTALDEPTAAVRLDAGPPGDPVTIEMLVLSVRRSRVEKYRAGLSARSIQSIERAHRDMADQIARMTGGRLRVNLTFRTVNEVLQPSLGDDDRQDTIRFDLEPDEVAPVVWPHIEPGAYDSVMVWGAIPRGYPQPALGVTFGGVIFGGATLSTGLIPSRRELVENSGRPPWLLPIHEWWHQVEQRAEDYLGVGVGWPPSNHAVFDAGGGRRLDPRTWLDEDNDTVIAWYEAVLAGMPSAFWADVWGDGERLDLAGDLAAAGVGIGDEIYASPLLTDGVLSFGSYPAAQAVPDAARPWFGVAMPAASAARAVVYVGDDTSDAPIWDAATLETSDDGEFWLPMDAELERDGATWTFRFAPRTVQQLRVVPQVAAGSLAACREIAVYAD